MILIIAYDLEGDGILEFLLFGSSVSGHKSKANILNSEIGTSPCMPTKLLGLSFSSSMAES